MSVPRNLYAVELDISAEAAAQGHRVPRNGYWVLHHDHDNDLPHVYATKREAREFARGCSHGARIVKFLRKAGE